VITAYVLCGFFVSFRTWLTSPVELPLESPTLVTCGSFCAVGVAILYASNDLLRTCAVLCVMVQNGAWWLL